MKRFGIWLLIGLLALAGILVMLDPTQIVLGTLSRDAFFESRPTRYWARALRSDPAEQAKSQARLEQGGAAAVPVLVGILQNFSTAEHAELRCTTIEILAKLGPDAAAAGPTLVETARDSDRHVQAVGVTALPQVGVSPDIAVPVLVGLLKTENSVVAARALSQYKAAAAPALLDLVELLQDKSQSVEARWNAARTIGKIGPEANSAVPVLIEMTHDQEPTIREHSAEAIGDIGSVVGPEAIAALVQSMSDPATRVRRDAVRSLGYIGPKAQAAIPDIKKLIDDPEQIVRDAARNALKSVAPDEPVPTSKLDAEAKSSK